MLKDQIIFLSKKELKKLQNQFNFEKDSFKFKAFLRGAGSYKCVLPFNDLLIDYFNVKAGDSVNIIPKTFDNKKAIVIFKESGADNE